MTQPTARQSALLDRTRIVQNAYVVNDIEAACARWHRLFGIGPFLGGVPFETPEHSYRGKTAAPLVMRTAFAQAGDLNIELIQIMSGGPNIFTDMYAQGAEGLHHNAIFTDDFAAERAALIAAGCPEAGSFPLGDGTAVAFIDARAAIGHMIELYPPSDLIRGMYAQVRAAAGRWRDDRVLVPLDEA